MLGCESCLTVEFLSGIVKVNYSQCFLFYQERGNKNKAQNLDLRFSQVFKVYSCKHGRKEVIVELEIISFVPQFMLLIIHSLIIA